jgi:hypothetical protein
MKKSLFLMSVSVAALVACQSGATKPAGAAQAAEVADTTAAVAIPFDTLLYVAESYVGKSVKVVGTVTHTCKHSGRRCFIVGSDRKVTLRVEAKGKIGGFNRELIGTQIEVQGILRERRVTSAEVEAMQQSLALKSEAEGEVTPADTTPDTTPDAPDASSCSAELQNIRKMQLWMRQHNKSYYATYYVDGEDFLEL